ncbi:WbuC family cupin fold metalloprotein [Bacteroides sp. 519]|uniref:WbuC family cupin fold metalloprotein n=1 Tax=Bacteroides sp. 519 TaxID=2302937 RepID=UPI0013D4DF05|nr:WbuC family cupin fold metalloprotein [Bacteroides sp. 519]NDV58527.1 cupin fold metalloprotein, WbuC family [Bacteroides sp. 519]
MKIISEELLNEVSKQAKENERLRMNYNFHESLDEPIHRLLNALEPGTYLPPHRHKNPDKIETYLILRGSLIGVLYNDEGDIIKKLELNPQKGIYGMEIPAGMWHSIVVLEPNTVIFEIKDGPYAPISAENIAPWAPDPSDDLAVKLFMEDILKD